MNWDAVAAIAEGLGAVGVVATLVYLASQIRQAERATLASLQHSTIVQGFQLNVACAAPETAPLIVKGGADFDALDPVERLRFALLMRATFACSRMSSARLAGVQSPRNSWLVGIVP